MTTGRGPHQRLRPETLESNKAWQGRIFDIRVDQVVLEPGSEPVEREYMNHPGGVGIVAVRDEDGEQEVLLLSQYRHPVRRTIWEVPAGLRDVEGETLLVTAQRELREEADLEAAQWDVLVDVMTSPGCSNEELRIFLARDPVPTGEEHQRSDEELAMELRWVPLGEAVAMILAGDIVNPSAVSGILATAVFFNAPGLSLRSGSGASVDGSAETAP